MPAVAAHPAFADLDPAFDPARLPSLAEWNARAQAARLALPGGRRLAFVAAAPAKEGALAYERRIAERGAIATRADDLHDACNALAWLAFPRTKAALNAIHVAAPPAATANGRDRRRDAATLLDESGLVVACTDDALVAHWRARRWRDAFGSCGAAGALAAMALGHGLLAKLRAPFRGITGHALLLPLDPATLAAAPAARRAQLDAAAAAALAASGPAFAPASLLPLPVAALPGWDGERLGGALFDDAAVFRTHAR